MPNVAVLTSGGDSAGMNAAVRSVVRTGLAHGARMYLVHEGLQGLVEGGGFIRPGTSADVGGILQEGGTALGTARSAAFREREGRRRAALHLVEHGIDALVVIGGDGSLTGADVLRTEWTGLLDELVDLGLLDRGVADRHRRLALAGLVASIDNDMCGTDMTIGADTALHRIVEAVDAIQSTASSHRRSFVVEVMGRHCGYLALMGGLATGANFVIIPERPPEAGWQAQMCDVLSAGRRIGRRANIVLIAEHSHDVEGRPITADGVKEVLQDRLGEDARVTILGHVQRGGAPSAYDRYLGTVLGHAATLRVLDDPDGEPQLFGVRGKRVVASPLMERVAETRSIASLIDDGRYDEAMAARGSGLPAAQRLLHTLTQAEPSISPGGSEARTIAVLHAGSPAPGMNSAIRTVVRVAVDAGHRVLAVHDGFRGLLDGRFEELGWMSVSGWAWAPGATLGTSSRELDADAAAHARTVLAERGVDGLLVIGGRAGYASAAELHRTTGMPVACVPASIHNNLPGCDHSIGADSALNSIMVAVDKIKQSAVAAHRCSVVEVMGRQSGYLALLSALATGAEQVYLPHHEVTLASLMDDLDRLRAGFAAGKRRGVVIRTEQPGSAYTTEFMAGMFAQESEGLFEVDKAILGHVQQGGAPSPFDRAQAGRLAAAGVQALIEAMGAGGDGRDGGAATGMMVGSVDGEIRRTPLADLESLLDLDAGLPRAPRWWHDLYPLVELLAEPS